MPFFFPFKDDLLASCLIEVVHIVLIKYIWPRRWLLHIHYLEGLLLNTPKWILKQNHPSMEKSFKDNMTF